MQLGNFSLSLRVDDIYTSLKFYEQLGFKRVMGEPDKKWAIIKNGSCMIGLFQGMFEQNVMTFNPKWDSSMQLIEGAEDIREIEAQIRAAGIVPVKSFEYTTDGPAHFVIEDPDGNVIMFDQHI